MGEPGENSLHARRGKDEAAHLRVQREERDEGRDRQQRVEKRRHHLIEELVQDHVRPLHPIHQVLHRPAVEVWKRQAEEVPEDPVEEVAAYLLRERGHRAAPDPGDQGIGGHQGRDAGDDEPEERK